MKKISLLCLLSTILLFSISQAQNLIAVQNGGSPTFYTKLDSAVYYAQNDDTLYLPGGTFFCGSLTIGKKLHLIGAGFHPDSSTATMSTHIYDNIIFGSNSEGSSLSGLEFTGLFVCSPAVCNSAGNYHISRCKINSVNLGDDNNEPVGANSNIFTENIINTLNGHYSQNNVFYNNLFEGPVFKLGYSNLFRNNIFFMGWYGLCGCGWINCSYAYFLFISNSFFENNIFLQGNYVSNVSFSCQTDTCTFRNNLFVDDFNLENLCPGCYSFDNLDNQPQNSIFINQSGNSFSWSHDYHLQSTCPGKNAGTDGTDIGVYGGYYPWKDGSMPFNPHVQFQNIYNSTGLNGDLKVNIKVSAQDH